MRGLAVLLALFCVSALVGVGTTASAAATNPTKFVPVALSKVESSALGEFGTKTVKVAGVGGVPATGAKAVMLNLTATDATTAGTFLTVWPSGDRPTTSNLHPIVGEPVNNSMVVPLADDGTISVYNHWGSVTVTVSVNGYFVEDTTGAGGFVPLTTSRIINTSGSPIPANGTLDVKVAGVAGVAADARSVFVNLTASVPTADGYVTIVPKGSTSTPRPVVAFGAGSSVANSASITPDASGYVTVKNNSTAPLNIVLDAEGYFAASTATGDTFQAITARVYDSRKSGDMKLEANEVISVSVDCQGDLPSTGVSSVFANIMAIDPATTGYVKVWSADEAEPALNQVIFHKDEDRASLVATKVSSDTTLMVKNVSNGPVHIIVDIQGWFAAPATAEAATATSAADVAELDELRDENEVKAAVFDLKNPTITPVGNGLARYEFPNGITVGGHAGVVPTVRIQRSDTGGCPEASYPEPETDEEMDQAVAEIAASTATRQQVALSAGFTAEEAADAVASMKGGPVGEGPCPPEGVMYCYKDYCLKDKDPANEFYRGRACIDRYVYRGSSGSNWYKVDKGWTTGKALQPWPFGLKLQGVKNRYDKGKYVEFRQLSPAADADLSSCSAYNLSATHWGATFGVTYMNCDWMNYESSWEGDRQAFHQLDFVSNGTQGIAQKDRSAGIITPFVNPKGKTKAPGYHLRIRYRYTGQGWV